MRRRTIAVLATAPAVAIGLSQAAQASITETQLSWSGTAPGWTGTPVFQTGATSTSDSGGTTNDNDSWGGDSNGTGTWGALAETFEVSAAGTLSTAQITMDGGTQQFNVELYDLGPAQAGYQSAPGNAPQVTQVNDEGGAVVPSTGGTYNGGLNLLASGDNFTYTAVANQALVTLTFTGTDAAVALIPGELYALSLDPTSNANGTWWERGGVPVAAYNTGEGLNEDGVDGQQAFEGKTSVRDFDTAITEVPEPTSLSLIGLGSLGLIARRRTKTE